MFEYMPRSIVVSFHVTFSGVCISEGGAAEFRVMPVPRDLYGELDISQLVATIRLPSGREEPCGLAKVPGGYLGTISISFGRV